MDAPDREASMSDTDDMVVGIPQNFAAALAMIAELPLSPAEKAEAVRRLLQNAG
jgi:hypothetical protein